MTLEEMQERVERYYINMENNLLMNIADKLSKGLPMEIDKYDLEKRQPIYGSGEVNEWQLERLKELGGLTEKNAETIAKYSGKTKDEVEKIFQRAREIGTEIDREQLEMGIKAGILNEINPIVEDQVVKGIIESGINKTLTTFNIENNSLLASANKEYTDIVNNVTTEVLSGTKTIATAMQESVSQLAEKGLTGFTARNGAQWTPEAYTKMVIRTNVRQTTNEVQEARFELCGNDLIEISSHMGARPLCAEDQGKVFSLSGANVGKIKDGLGNTIEVYDWNKSSYGEPAGILGINCGHSRYAFIPNLSIYREKHIDRAENDEAYREKQEQRSYERAIRNKKREIDMLKTTGAEQDYIKSKKEQLSSYNKEYLDFLNKTGRTRISSNEWIGSLKRDLNEKSKDDIIIKEVRYISGRKNAKIELNYNIPNDIENYFFDDKHINADREHNITKDEAISYVKNSKLKMTVWQGKYENYYSDNGTTYIDTKNKIIRSSYSSVEYDERTKKIMEVINNGRK